RLEFSGLRVERGSDFGEELLASIDGRAIDGRGHAADGRASAGGSVVGELAVTDLELQGFYGKTKGIAGDHQHAGARAGADVLRAHLYGDGAVGEDAEIAVARVSAATPGMEREAESALYRASSLVAPRVPTIVPSHQLVGDLKFFGVDACPRLGECDVLEHEVQWIHVELGGHVVERAHGDDACLGMVGRAPRA